MATREAQDILRVSQTRFVDRVLVSLTVFSVDFQTRPAQLPSSTFITAYLDAFRPRSFNFSSRPLSRPFRTRLLTSISCLVSFLSTDPAPALPEPSTQADSTLILAFEALEAGDHKHAFTLAQEALTQGITWTEGKAEALNLRGTFK